MTVAGSPLPRTDAAAGALAAVALALVFAIRLEPPDAAVAAGGCAALVLLSLVDLRHHRLPNVVVLPSAAIVLAARAGLDPAQATHWLVPAVAAFAAMTALVFLLGDGLGMGDAKLALLLGALVGPEVVHALALGALGAGLVAGAMLVRRGTAARRTPIAFGPFLALGTIVVLLG